jgi:hypothetical protein
MSYTRLATKRWGLMWYSKNCLDGETRHLIYDNCIPVLFKTRREARDYANKRYGYIKTSPDLRGEPHGWRMPKAILVRVEALTLPMPRPESQAA